jgi:hypothetical protein
MTGTRTVITIWDSKVSIFYNFNLYFKQVPRVFVKGQCIGGGTGKLTLL